MYYKCTNLIPVVIQEMGQGDGWGSGESQGGSGGGSGCIYHWYSAEMGDIWG